MMGAANTHNTDPYTIDPLSYLSSLDEELSANDGLKYYDVLKPSLSRLRTENPPAFDLAVKQIVKQIGIKAKTVRDDLAGLAEPLAAKEARKLLEKIGQTRPLRLAQDYQASRIKRHRRTKAEMAALRTALYEIVKAHQPVTIRQAFYLAVSRQVIEKTENEYDTVGRLLVQMRRQRCLPFGWIADNTRWMRKPQTHDSFEQALQLCAETYRRSVWQNQSAYVEVWLEKDALAGALYEVTGQWDVPLMVTRGYPSLTYLHEAAMAFAECEKPAYVYYFGDHDPSGVDIPRKVEAGLREFAPDAEIYFQRVAVTPERITELQLLTRPTKKTDSRSKHFAGESVEVDAIPPDMLRALVRECIATHINPEALHCLQVTERSERTLLMRIAHEAYGEGEDGRNIH